MADSKISALTAITALAGAEEFVVNDSGASKKITAANALKRSALMFSGARVTKSADQTAATATLTWNQEDYDTDGYHDNATNNDRLTVPATGRYRFTAFFRSDNTLDGFFTLSKNGGDGYIQDYKSGLTWHISVDLAMTAGDYCSVGFFKNSGTGNFKAGPAGGYPIAFFAVERIS